MLQVLHICWYAMVSEEHSFYFILNTTQLYLWRSMCPISIFYSFFGVLSFKTLGKKEIERSVFISYEAIVSGNRFLDKTWDSEKYTIY